MRICLTRTPKQALQRPHRHPASTCAEHTCSPAAYLASVSLKAESFMVVPILVFASTIFLRICRNLMVRASAWTPAPLLAGYIRHRGTELSMSLSCIPCMCLLPPLFTTALQTLKPILTRGDLRSVCPDNNSLVNRTDSPRWFSGAAGLPPSSGVAGFRWPTFFFSSACPLVAPISRVLIMASIVTVGGTTSRLVLMVAD
jgi:hypothetical protein